MMMTPPNLSMMQLVTVFVVFTLVAIPSAILLKRGGHNPLWALLCYFPILAIIGLWVLALRAPGTGEA